MALTAGAPVPGLSPSRGLLLFAGAVFVFHQLPALLPRPAADAVDLLTPFAVIGAAAALLRALRARPVAAALGLFAGLLYVDGHGIHLAANSIAAAEPVGEAQRIAYFWDERFSHVESLLGWVGLVAAFCLAAGRRAAPAGGSASLGAAAGLLGFTFFTSTVEGQTWWLLLGVAPLFAVWGYQRREPLITACAAAYGLACALIGAWALAHGGVPELSDVGLI